VAQCIYLRALQAESGCSLKLIQIILQYQSGHHSVHMHGIRRS